MTRPAGDDDARAFEEAMRGAKPLPPGGRARVSPPTAAQGSAPPRRPRAPRPASLDVDVDVDAGALTESTRFEIERSGEAIEGRATGIDARLLRRLKAGEFPVESRLDLHGRARAHALAALTRFVERERADGTRCVLIIHGRGAHSCDDGPVLRPLVWRWLGSSSLSAMAVMAFASARPALGGVGATLLLLRKPGR